MAHYKGAMTYKMCLWGARRHATKTGDNYVIVQYADDRGTLDYHYMPADSFDRGIADGYLFYDELIEVVEPISIDT